MANYNRLDNTTTLNLAGAWSAGGPPTAADTGTWAATNVATNTTTAFAASASWLGAVFNATQTSAITVNATGNAILTLGTSGINASAAAANHTFAIPITLGGNQTWNINSGRALTASGQLTGSGTLTKEGAGDLVLTGSGNTNSGNVTLSAGNTQLASLNSGTPDQLNGVTTVTLAGGTIFYRGNTTTIIGHALTGSTGGEVYVRNTSATGVTFSGSWSGLQRPVNIYADAGEGGATSQTLTLSTNTATAFTYLLMNNQSSVTVNQTLKYTGTSTWTCGQPLLLFRLAAAGIRGILHNASSGNITWSGLVRNEVAFPVTFEIKNDSSGVTTISGNITQASSGALAVEKTGSGTATLTGNNAFTNPCNVLAGTLNANAATALGAASSTAGISVSSGATLSLGAALNYSGFGRTTTISGTGVSTSGALVHAFAGTANVGAISLGAAAYIRGTASGTSTLSSAIATDTGKNLTAGAASGNTLTLTGGISGAGSLIVGNSSLDTGTVALTVANNYSGGTTIRAGTVVAGNANALGSSGTVTLNDASTGNANTSLLLNSVTVSRAITVANQGSGTTTLGANGAVAFPTFSGAITLAKAVTLDGSTNTDRLTFTGGIGGTGNVTIVGTKRVVFDTTANTYAGTTTINSGAILQLGTGASTALSFLPDGYSVAVNGTLNFAKGSNSETIDALTGSGVVDNPVSGAATLIVGSAGGSGSFSGVIKNTAGTLGLTKQGAGTQTLTGANTYTGATTVSGGALSFFGSGASLGGGTYAGAITNDGTLTFFTPVAHTLSGTISGTGKLSNGGAGTLTLSAAAGNKSTANALAGGGAFSFLTNGSAYSLSGNMSELEGAVGLVSGTSGSRTVVACSASALGSTLMTMTLNDYGVYLISNDEGAVTATHNIGSLSSAFSTSIIAGSGFAGTRTGTKTLSVGALNASTTHAGVIADEYSGGGSVVAFTKVGTGTQTLSGTNTYTGAVAVNAGTLVAASSTALGAASSAAGISVAYNTTLRLNEAATYASRTLTLTGSGVGDITGALVLANTGTNTFGGISFPNVPSGAIAATASATLAAPIATSAVFISFNASAGSVFTLDSTSIIGASTSQVFFNALTTLSLGTVVVSAQNLYTGTTTVSRGELRVAASSTGTPGSVTSGPLGRGTLQWSNGTLDVSSSITLHNAVSLLGNLVFTGAHALTLAGAFSVSGSRVLTTNGTGGALTVSGALSGNVFATLTKAGTNTLAFSSASTFAGSIVVTDGVLVAGNTEALGTAAGVTLSAGATFHVLTTGNGGIQNGRLTIASLNNAAGGTIKIGG